MSTPIHRIAAILATVVCIGAAIAQGAPAGPDFEVSHPADRDGDWKRLHALLGLEGVPRRMKRKWAIRFMNAYLESAGIDEATGPELFGVFNDRVVVADGPAAPRPARRPASGSGGAVVEWVKIPAGSFWMGDKGLSWMHPQPIHRVTLKAFALARTEVTNKQYRACVEAGACAPAHFSDGTCNVYDGEDWKPGSLPASFQGDDQPVVCVDWQQARDFCEWAGGRLPSEAEWEYAARSAGKDWKYPWGNENGLCETAVLNDGDDRYGCGRGATWPVCSKSKGNTEQGLCDMAGNAWEWIEDWFHAPYDGAPADGRAWEKPATGIRVKRGGSWRSVNVGMRTAYRNASDPRERADFLGFRPARSRP